MKLLSAVVFAVAAPIARADDRLDHFESHVRPILVARCEKCHGTGAQKGGLRLDLRGGWEQGGDRGPAVVPGRPDESPLVEAVRYEDESLRMPPDARLPDHEVEALVRWVREGAVDPREVGEARLGGMALAEARRWWSLRPVTRPAVPTPQRPGAGPIDAFLAQRLEAAGIAPGPPADRRTLLRRVSYDLTGLPPTPDEVDAFLRDERPDAYDRLVDRLLASPQYGERWGRHWLDLVRYADTAGENTDHPIPQAWRYRNWVIAAFNRDLPYDRFLREQLAGDLLAAEDRPDAYADHVVATGFLAIARRFGHDIDKDLHLTHEDIIGTLGKAMLGLTLACARCHDHKYDPITTRDYYALYGILDSTRLSFPGCEPRPQPRDLVSLLPPAEQDRIARAHQGRIAEIEAGERALDTEAAGVAFRWNDRAAGATHPLAAGTIDDGGKHEFEVGTDPAAGPISVKPGDLLLLTVLPQANHGADSTAVEWTIAEADGPRRTWELTGDVVGDLLASNPHADRHGHDRVWWFLDLRGPRLLEEPVRDHLGRPGLHVWRNGDTPSAFANATAQPIPVWTPLPARTLFVHPTADGGVAVAWRSPIAGRVTVRARLADAHPGGPDGIAWRLDRIGKDRADALGPLGELARRREALRRQRAAIEAERPPADLAYGAAEGTPHDARIHLRGDPEKPGAEVPRRWLEALGGQPVPRGAGSGRRQLADWIAGPENPLTARVLVNRLWQHHFGQGLVRTPSDFGTRGLPPTHPELLDWLALELVANDWRIKPLHRQILLSDAYRRGSVGASPPAIEADPDNLLLARFARRRLTAEELRDSLLVVGGRLDTVPGGPHPFPPEASWSFTQHNPFNASYPTDRRSVYLLIQRNRRDPFLALFDGADPNDSTPIRQETTVPTQALYFLNAPGFHDACARLAARVVAGREAVADRLDALFRLALQRTPQPDERAWAARFLQRYGDELRSEPEPERTRQAWAALARVVLGSNEFLYLD